MLVKKTIDRVRLKITDDNAYRFTDDDILEIVNEAVRFMRNIYMEQVPELIMEEPICGTLDEGENSIELPYQPLRIVDVRCNGKSLHVARLKNIEDTAQTGIPTVFTPVGQKGVLLFPVPNSETAYSLYLIKAADELTEDDELPFPDDFEDSIIEFVAMRLSMIDEYDESVEVQLTTQIYNNISNKLMRFTATPCVVDSYY